VRVPMHQARRPGYGGSAESLNLAASVAVVLYEAVRQRQRSSGR
jgi:tRNA(Leu) C34 or U34 (ribose-2'-O)-methylase TrmL